MLFLLGCDGRGGDVRTDTWDSAPGDDTGIEDSGWSATDAWGARYDCGAMDPADAAPLGGFIALTFDDGPSADYTPQILEVLRRNEVPATFFYVGSMAADPAVDWIIEDVVADPLFSIGNHTWDHVDLLDGSTSDARAQMEQTSDLLSEYGVVPRFFRFPYGEGTCAQVDVARAAGMHVTGWHIDTADWCYAQGGGTCSPSAYWRVPDEWASDMVGNTLEQFVQNDGGMVLFHDVWQFTADELETVILEAKAAGFTFVRLDDERAFPGLNTDHPDRLPWIGQACSVAEDPCWQVENFAWCEPGGDPEEDADAGACVLPCSQPCFTRDGGPATSCVSADGGSGR